MEEEPATTDELSAQASFEHDLLSRLQECLSTRKKHVVYSKVIIKWEEVAFDGHSAEECHKCWLNIQSRLRLQRTIGELIDDAQAARWDPSRLRKAIMVQRSKEGAPKRPGNAYYFFTKKMRPKLAKKYPGLGLTEMSSKLSQRYASLSAEKKQVFADQAAEALAQYKKELKEFERNHPELTLESADGPKRPPRALELFIRARAAHLPRAEALAAYRALPAEERKAYSVEADQLHEQYVAEAQAYKEQYPGWEIPASARRKPAKKRQPRNAFNVFVQETYPTVDPSLSNAKRLRICSEMWHEADAKTKARCQKMAEEEREDYLEYVNSLPEEEQADVRAKMAPRAKTTARSRMIKKLAGRVKRLSARTLFMREKMPSETDGMLSQEEWRRILARKFKQLSDADKEEYAQRARALTKEAREKAITELIEQGEELAEHNAGGEEEEEEGQEEEDEETPIAATPPKSKRPRVPATSNQNGDTPRTVIPLENGPTSNGLPESPEIGRKKEKRSMTSEDYSTEGYSTAEDGSPKKKKKKKKKEEAEQTPAQSVPEEETPAQSVPEEETPAQSVPEEETPAQSVPEEIDSNAVFEWFVENYRPASMETLKPHKQRKKAKKAWNELTDHQRRVTVRKYRKQLLAGQL
ncbi:nucleolar transcription factor 1-B-like [Amphibalanus amphitrite]|uniref:nucleolar transcription factor 1-B-like n=1 Tax=Amphibalanus amphitrite TaxID=1232801 RepID=UPI001C901752|nr:nucleolar transcription factor 1-B-like [Amphibalanus amphitrite]XP_043194883.1 nucleolar transcription factor 1-B-like [Amphibalanus amphitrite]XP_043194884.1 nucleolar transcription factor 1-B-like [Amphibalanus amphitrite]XP_043194885.1 nucleolar transcription factor 1-B-like [Amphibalanus amphitrite]XP_043194886.1 nucleolar transcription factor 1-B-like [Amphibalanus amphitrite]